MPKPDPVLVVGTVAYDTVKTPFQDTERALGGSALYFSASASLFTDVHLVSVVGGDFDLNELNPLQERGVNLDGLHVEDDGQTFHWSGEYHYDMNTRTTHATDLNVLETFQPHVPEPAQATPLAFLANIDPTLQTLVLDQLTNQPLVAADTMNYWIENTPSELKNTLTRVDTLIINDEEARELANTPNLVEAMHRIQALGPDVITVKKGEHGSILMHQDEWFTAPAFLHADVTDPTGAGDAFAGGFMGTLASTDTITHQALRKATVYGTAAASIVIEDFGPRALLDATRDDLEQRAKDLARYAKFPPVGKPTPT